MVLGRVGSVSSSRVNVPQPDPRQPVKPKSWAPSGMVSWTILIVGERCRKVQVMWAPAVRVTVARRPARSTVPPGLQVIWVSAQGTEWQEVDATAAGGV